MRFSRNKQQTVWYCLVKEVNVNWCIFYYFNILFISEDFEQRWSLELSLSFKYFIYICKNLELFWQQRRVLMFFFKLQIFSFSTNWSLSIQRISQISLRHQKNMNCIYKWAKWVMSQEWQARKVWKVIKSSIKTVSIIILGKLANSLFISTRWTLIHSASAAQNITPLTQKLCK